MKNHGMAAVSLCTNQLKPPPPGHSGGFDKNPKQMRSKPPAPGAYFWVKTLNPWERFWAKPPQPFDDI
jgi:hypothetical protein